MFVKNQKILFGYRKFINGIFTGYIILTIEADYKNTPTTNIRQKRLMLKKPKNVILIDSGISRLRLEKVCIKRFPMKSKY